MKIYTVKDIMAETGLSYDTACRIVRQVKSESDVLKIRGVITEDDWDIYKKKRANF